MNKKLENLCGYKKRAEDRRIEENNQPAGSSKSYTTIYKRWGCYTCMDEDDKCKQYYPGVKVKR